MIPFRFVVAELHYPGTWISLSNTNTFNISRTLTSLELTLNEAAVALSCYESSKQLVRQSFDNQREHWDFWNSRRRIISEQLRRNIPNNPENYFENLSIIELEAERLVRKEQLENGIFPNSYLRLMPHMYARTYLYALDRIRKLIDIIAADQSLTQNETASIAQIKQNFQNTFPNLIDVRDTSAHYDERSQGRARNRQINPQPVNNNFINTSGGAIILEQLNGNNFGSTMADGSYGEVEISISSLFAARDSIQQIINSFTWTGPGRFQPFF